MDGKELTRKKGTTLAQQRLDQTRGLAAPRPKAGEELVPNEAGWLIAFTGLEQRSRPRLWWCAQRAPALGGFLGFLITGVTHLPMPLSFPLGAASLVAAWQGVGVYIRRSLRRQVDAIGTGDVATVAAGTLVRLRGRIAPGPVVPTLFRGVPAVLFRNRIGGADETRGIDFTLLVDGQPVRVSAREALLLDGPTRTREEPACGPVYCDPWSNGDRDQETPRLCSALFVPPPGWFRVLPSRRYESSVGPGDEIEVCGVLHREEDPAGRDAFARQVPVVAVLRAGRLPLVVRSVARR